MRKTEVKPVCKIQFFMLPKMEILTPRIFFMANLLRKIIDAKLKPFLFTVHQEEKKKVA